MFLRRSATALAAASVLSAAAAPLALVTPASAASLADKGAGGAPAALYGKSDPTYDGVWRQSLALLAQDVAGVRPAPKAAGWLADQQCADGSFAAYRPDPAQPCGEKTVADTNATAAAVQALSAVGGHEDTVRKAVKWLKSAQNDDGGWSYNPGGPSDANSVAVVIGALTAVGEDPAKTTAGKQDASPYDALTDLQLGCDADAADRGAFAYQPDDEGGLTPNGDATAAAALAGTGNGFVVDPLRKGEAEKAEPLPCDETDGDGDGKEPAPEAAAAAGAAYLTKTLKKDDWHLRSAMPGSEDQPDYGNTADAVVALAAGGHGDAARSALDWLEKNLDDWEGHETSPAALGQLVLAAHAAGADPRDFGGVDVVKRLNATGPKPAAVQEKDTQAAQQEEDGDGWRTASVIGALFLAGIGLGFLLSKRRKQS